MGILEFISNEHAGIIPRAVAQIFHYYEYQQLHHPGNEITISMSFLQLYRETIQDLLAPASSASGANNANNTGTDDNLAIREDPQRGFYVEGLQEFVVRNYQESGACMQVNVCMGHVFHEVSCRNTPPTRHNMLYFCVAL